MDYLTYLAILTVIAPGYVLTYMIVVWVGRRIDMVLFAPAPARKFTMVELYLGRICDYFSINRRDLHNQFTDLFIDTTWYKK